MHTSFFLGLVLTLGLVAGCGAGGTATADGGSTTPDTSTGAQDSGSPGVDGGNDAATAPSDAGSDAGGSTIDAGSTCPPPGTGATCSATVSCGSGTECNLGRCIPQGRETCGGFAARPCTMSPYTQCTYQPGHGDVGTCLSPDELTCVCATDPTNWTCG